MKSSFLIKLSLIGVVVVALSFLITEVVSAHGGREVGEYEINVGFMDEPAYEGRLNSVDLRIEMAETGAPVEGLGQTLQVEVARRKERLADGQSGEI